jgi:transposase
MKHATAVLPGLVRLDKRDNEVASGGENIGLSLALPKGMDETMEHLDVGIDVGKGEFKVCCTDDRGHNVTKRMRLKANKADMMRLHEYLDAGKIQGLYPRIALEATGIYFLPVYTNLAPQYEICVYNPVQTKVRARGRVRLTKTDKRDALDLAKALSEETPPKTNYKDKFQFELRELCRYHSRLNDQRADLMKRYVDRVYMLFPLFETVFDNVNSKAARAIIKNAQTPEEILALGEDKLVEIAKLASRNHVDREQIKQLMKAAEETISTDISREAVKLELLSIQRVLETIEQEIDLLEKKILELWSTKSNEHFLQTIPGIGDLSAAAIWSEIGNADSYTHVDQWTALAGLDLIVCQTGKRNHNGTRITRHGSKYLRKYLGNIVVSCRNFNPAITNYLKKKKDQGMKFNKARCAASKKILRQIWFVERNKKPFVVLEEKKSES